MLFPIGQYLPAQAQGGQKDRTPGRRTTGTMTWGSMMRGLARATSMHPDVRHLLPGEDPQRLRHAGGRNQEVACFPIHFPSVLLQATIAMGQRHHAVRTRPQSQNITENRHFAGGFSQMVIHENILCCDLILY